MKMTDAKQWQYLTWRFRREKSEAKLESEQIWMVMAKH
jgi:hypothetical protein